MKADRNRIVNEEQSLALEKVVDFSIFESFSCGDNDLNDYIRNDAKAHKKELLSETYMLRLQNVNQPIAFCSLCNDSIQFSQEVRKKILPEKKQYRYHPAVKIARIGVIKDLQSRKFGSHLIDLIKHLFVIDNRTGCRFITVDAYNKEKVLSFYQRNNFQFLSEKDAKKDTRSMYFDLKRLIISENMKDSYPSVAADSRR